MDSLSAAMNRGPTLGVGLWVLVVNRTIHTELPNLPRARVRTCAVAFIRAYAFIQLREPFCARKFGFDEIRPNILSACHIRQQSETFTPSGTVKLTILEGGFEQIVLLNFNVNSERDQSRIGFAVCHGRLRPARAFNFREVAEKLQHLLNRHAYGHEGVI